MSKKYESYDTIVLACYNDIARDIRVGERFTVMGKQKGRSGKTWQIILKPFAKTEKKQ